MNPGVFISFEGSEGCGKSTQIKLLTNLLKDCGQKVIVTREPGGTVVGEKIRDLLQFTPEAKDMTDESELLLFAASRAQLVRQVIRPSLEQGIWVIADRFFDSTTVYQGIGRGLSADKVDQINRFAVGETMPNWTLLLDMDAEAGHARAVKARGAKQKDRIEDQPMDFFQRVREGYLTIAKSEPERIEVIDASLSIDEVAANIQEACLSRFEWLTK